MHAICPFCKKFFSRQFNLDQHCRLKHDIKKLNYSYPRNKFKFVCLDCSDRSFKNGDALMDHLTLKHSFKVEQEIKDFESMEEFKSWKVNIEVSEKCSYVAHGGKNNLSSGDVIQYFRCCRSGNRKSSTSKDIAERKRKMKSKGSMKLAHACISKITLKMQENKISAKRIITHYGHLTDIQHLRISKLEKEQLAFKLMDGVSTTKILDDVRKNIGSDLKRVDLLTRQDLKNIKKRYNISERVGLKHNIILSSSRKLCGNEHNVVDDCLSFSNKTNVSQICNKRKRIKRNSRFDRCC